MKRSKQVCVMIDIANKFLRAAKIRSTNDPVFVVFQASLIEANAYEGFNYYRDEIIKGEKGPVMCKPKDSEYLLFW